MRWVYLLFLLAFVAAVVVLAIENQQDVPLTVFKSSFTTSVPILVGATYVAGMLSGWTVVGLIRRSVRKVFQESAPAEPSRAR
jgi:hypothetical protein